MEYRDPVYGKQDISEGVLRDLMASDALRRLDGVLQHGVTALIGITAPFSRYEHSVGAMLLVRRLGGSLAEQIAALLHDVSHTAFSHVVDFVVGDHREQAYHEACKETVVRDSDIPAVLDRHGYDWRAFLDETAFPLLEQPAPALCADRLDYFLRDVEYMGLATPAAVEAVLDSLTVRNGRLALTDRELARWLGYTFMEADRASWSNPREVGLYELTAEAIRAALDGGEVTEADLWTTDRELWNRLRSASRPEVRVSLERISADTRFPHCPDGPELRVASKVRTLDPEVAVDGGVQPLSRLDPRFARDREAYRAAREGEWTLGVLPPPGRPAGPEKGFDRKALFP